MVDDYGLDSLDMNYDEVHIKDDLVSDEKEKNIWEILNKVNDPEIPVISVIDLGIVRDIRIDDNKIEVIITPTYSGCPAMDMIATDIRKALLRNGYEKIKITHQLSPAWTSDWISESGKEKLESYGIAPPKTTSELHKTNGENIVRCPYCYAPDTTLISEFGSTACKALYKCNVCGEPFDHFKCH